MAAALVIGMLAALGVTLIKVLDRATEVEAAVREKSYEPEAGLQEDDCD